MLKSRTVADELIQRFDLKKTYGEEYLFDTRKELARNSSIVAGREGVITIDVDDKDPKRAADIANAYVETMRSLTLRLAVGEAGQRRLFFESQLKQAKNDLVSAELQMKRYTQESGLVVPQGQVGLTVAAAAALRAQITAKEIQLAAMRSFATESNPDIARTNQELAGLRKEMGKLEGATKDKGDVLVPMGKAPDTGMEYIRRFRDVKYYETLFEILAKQYEIARIDEAKDATLIQVLDVATVPEKKSWPRKAIIVTLAFVIALVFGAIAAFYIEVIRRSKRDPDVSSKLSELSGLLSLKGFRRV
jgi:uncharacterized protein involved in exopolysaccharide biosynthesis